MPNYDFQLCIANSRANKKLLNRLKMQKGHMNISLLLEEGYSPAKETLFLDQTQVSKLERMGYIVSNRQQTNMEGIFYGEISSVKDIRKKPKANQPERKFPPTLKKSYITACVSRLDKQYKKNLKQIDLAQVKLQAAQKAVSENIHVIESLQPLVYAAKKLAGESKTKFDAEFEALISNQKILQMEIDSDSITVYTPTLYCIDPRSGIEHEIGKMKIIIYINDCYIKFLNLTRHVNGVFENMEAPHVEEGGDACLGTLHSIVAELFARHEYAALVHLCIQYIETVNVNDDGGSCIAEWPRSNRNASDQRADAPIKIKRSDIGKKTSAMLKKSIDVLAIDSSLKTRLKRMKLKTIGQLVSKTSRYLYSKKYGYIDQLKTALSEIGLGLRANKDGEDF